MTMYHRGRAKSVYRKRSQTAALTFASTFSRDVVTLAQPPSSGSTLIKSVRGLGLATLNSTSNAKYAAGWVGFARYARPIGSDSTLDISESEVFGVKSWSCGPKTDMYFELDLKGITLTKDESWYLVGECNLLTQPAGAIIVVQFLYAEHEVPA